MIAGKDLAPILGVTPQALSKAAKEGHYCADHDVSRWAVRSASGFVKGYDVPSRVLDDHVSGDGYDQVDQPPPAPPSPSERPSRARSNPDPPAVEREIRFNPTINVDQPDPPEVNVSVEPPQVDVHVPKQEPPQVSVNVEVEERADLSALWLLAGLAIGGGLIYWIHQLPPAPASAQAPASGLAGHAPALGVAALPAQPAMQYRSLPAVTTAPVNSPYPVVRAGAAGLRHWR